MKLSKLEEIADKLKRGKNMQSGVGVADLLHMHYGMAISVLYKT